MFSFDIAAVLTSLFFLSTPTSSIMIFPDRLSILLCKTKCKTYSGCGYVLYGARTLQCGLLFEGRKAKAREESETRLIKVQIKNFTISCNPKDKIFYNNHGFVTCRPPKRRKTISTNDRKETVKRLSKEEMDVSLTTDATVFGNFIADGPKDPMNGKSLFQKGLDVSLATVATAFGNLTTEGPQESMTVKGHSGQTMDVSLTTSTSVDNLTSNFMPNDSKTVLREPKKDVYTRKDNGCNGTKKKAAKCVKKPNKDKKEEDDKHCIVYEQTNLTYRIENKRMPLPIRVLPGMKLTARGSYIKDLPYSQFSITKDPEHLERMWKWLHTRAEWGPKILAITEGLSNSYFKGSFPISDPTDFTISYELTQSETKIYVNKVLVKSLKSIPFIQDCVIRRYSKIYLLIQRTGGRCGEMNYGLH